MAFSIMRIAIDEKAAPWNVISHRLIRSRRAGIPAYGPRLSVKTHAEPEHPHLGQVPNLRPLDGQLCVIVARSRRHRGNSVWKAADFYNPDRPFSFVRIFKNFHFSGTFGRVCEAGDWTDGSGWSLIRL
jgi:hypothetical protein